MTRRAPFVVTVGLVAGASLVACGGSIDNGDGSNAGTGGSGTGGTSGSGTGGTSGAGTGGAHTGGTGVGGTASGGTGVGGAYSTGGMGGNPPPPWEPCPTVVPTQGEWCWTDPAVWCRYDGGPCCEGPQARCTDYAWEVMYTSCNPPPPEPCPEVAPDEGSPCGSSDPCATSYYQCDYCASEATVAWCQNGVWTREFGPCGG